MAHARKQPTSSAHRPSLCGRCFSNLPFFNLTQIILLKARFMLKKYINPDPDTVPGPINIANSQL